MLDGLVAAREAEGLELALVRLAQLVDLGAGLGIDARDRADERGQAVAREEVGRRVRGGGGVRWDACVSRRSRRVGVSVLCYSPVWARRRGAAGDDSAGGGGRGLKVSVDGGAGSVVVVVLEAGWRSSGGAVSTGGFAGGGRSLGEGG